MKIIVDAFGGDNAPLEIIKGCAEAVAEFDDLSIILTGDEGKILKVANDNNISLDRIEIHHCTEVITMDDHADAVLKSKKDSSMAVGFNLLKNGEGDAFVSAGNSGALCMGATLAVKRIKGIKRPAFSPVMPSAKGRPCKCRHRRSQRNRALSNYISAFERKQLKLCRQC